MWTIFIIGEASKEWYEGKKDLFRWRTKFFGPFYTFFTQVTVLFF